MLDADKLGGQYPPDNPLGVDDPTRDDHVTDDLATRTLREDPEGEAAFRSDPDGERVANLTLTDLDEGAGPDEEKDLVANAVSGEEDDPLANDRVPVAPEEAAVHTESQ